MAKAEAQNPIFTNEDAAREALEAVRWPDGPICPHCGNAKMSQFPNNSPLADFLCGSCNEEFELKGQKGRFERHLGDLYPGNQNVRPKIRQQLQYLRDRGFIDFVSRGNYRLRS